MLSANLIFACHRANSFCIFISGLVVRFTFTKQNILKMSSKNLILIFVLSFCVVGQATAQKKKKRGKKAKAKTEKVIKTVAPQKMDTTAYSIGLMMGLDMKKQGLQQLDPAAIAQAIEDVFKERDFALDEERANQIATDYQKEQKALIGLKNLELGQKFLEENAEKEGVKVTASGLQYKIMEGGDGDIPTSSDQVRVHYHGTLIDGSVFDSSVERGQPINFPVMGVIKGWQEALQLMPVGSIWRVFIPAKLAYGNRGPGEIGPNSTLIFDIELLAIE